MAKERVNSRSFQDSQVKSVNSRSFQDSQVKSVVMSCKI